jgi:hypothetical protein
MRLLNTETIKFLHDDEERPSKYAILSHTWGKGEVLFTDIISGTAESKPAYEKVLSACQRAAIDGYQYIWIDNCCIDKTSSAELTEAINSMYIWYQQAHVCYAYLSGVASNIDTKDPEFENDLAGAKWFKRGWTLQELLAPANMIFFSEHWTIIGDKKGLRSVLSNITGIDKEILEDSKRLDLASVAKRMSWAAGRETTRPEDLAYCLMGIFSVNMPMLYGEGSVKAFLRLQEEIMKQSDDQSIFAWTVKGVGDSTQHGLLADSPSAFRNSNKIGPYQDWESKPPYSMTNRGLSIELPLTRLHDDIWVAALDCPVPPAYPDSSFLAIYLRKLPLGEQQFTRVQLGRFTQVRERGAMRTIHVRQIIHHHEDYQQVFPRHIFQLRNGPSREDYQVVNVVTSHTENSKQAPPSITSRAPVQEWVSGRFTFSTAKEARHLAVAIIFERAGEQLVIMLGSTVDFQVGFDSAAVTELELNRLALFESSQSYFDPTEPGTAMSLENHQVKVSMDPVISGGNKYYMVDIELTYTPRRMSTLAMIEDFVFGEPPPEDFGEISMSPVSEQAAGEKLSKKKSLWNRIKKR